MWRRSIVCLQRTRIHFEPDALCLDLGVSATDTSTDLAMLWAVDGGSPSLSISSSHAVAEPNVRKVSVCSLLAAAVLVNCVALARADDELKDFIAQYKCAIVERLELLHIHPRDRDRFLIVEMVGRNQSFVQCLFSDQNPRQNSMLCEAASGAYEARRTRVPFVKMSAEALSALAALGFATDDTDGNYPREVTYTETQEFGTTAELLLTALFQAYGARLGIPLTLRAPLAPVSPQRSRCIPIG